MNDTCEHCGCDDNLHYAWCVVFDDDCEDENTIPGWQDHVCEYCHGTGGNLYDDGVTPCRHCYGVGSWL